MIILPRHLQIKIDENTVIEDVEDDVDDLPDSDFSKSAARVFDKIDNRKYGVLPLSKFVDLIETLGKGFHSEDLEGQLQKVDPNKSGSFDHFAFVRRYVDKEVSLDSTEEGELLVGWA